MKHNNPLKKETNEAIRLIHHRCCDYDMRICMNTKIIVD